VPDAEFEALLGRPIPENKVHIDRNMTLGEMGHGRSPIGWLAAAVLGTLLRRSIKKGKPDLNILFQYNMPLRALAKMTNGAISMGMVDGIVMSCGLLGHRPCAGDRGGREEPRAEQPHGRASEKQLKGSRL